MAMVSRQSAFWAIVALGLNTFVQDGGRVLGFPVQYSRALRLSPIVCIVDTLGVLFSIAFFWYKTGSVKDGFTLTARYRCLTEDNPAEPKWERTWWYRFFVFALGVLPQAVKLLGMGGIPLTKTWGMAYLVSFLVIEGLDLLQPRQYGDERVLKQHAAVLDKYIILISFLAVYTQGMFFMMEVLLIPLGLGGYMCDMESSSSLPLPNPGKKMRKSISIITSIPYWLSVLLSPFMIAWAINLHYERTLRPLGENLLEEYHTTLVSPIIITVIELGTLLVYRESMCPSTAKTTVLALLLTLFLCVFIRTETSFKVRWLRKLFGVQYIERGEGYFLLTSAAANIAGIVCYYMYIYDPSSTYKPSWTENLG